MSEPAATTENRNYYWDTSRQIYIFYSYRYQRWIPQSSYDQEAEQAAFAQAAGYQADSTVPRALPVVSQPGQAEYNAHDAQRLEYYNNEPAYTTTSQGYGNQPHTQAYAQQTQVENSHNNVEVSRQGHWQPNAQSDQGTGTHYASMPPPPPRPPPTHIGGTGGEYEVLDPSYRVYRPGSTFFVPGCVFKILWFEPSGSTQMRRGTSITRDARFGEDVHAKIRWFVVIQEGDENWCRCLPINTYDYRGVAKHGVVKANHSIIFTHTEPDPQPEEYPRPYEQGMRSSIKVIPRDGYGSLHEMSRIHFRKIYTVEHNVKVYHFGNVDPQYMDVLIGHYRDANAV